MSLGLRADPTNTSGVISVAGVDQVVITNASNVVATTFTGALVGNASTATALSTATGTAPSFGARAWVSFNGQNNTSNVADATNTTRYIFGQGAGYNGNVTSVLRQATGQYVVSFSTPMSDANYGFALSAHHLTGSTPSVACSAFSVTANSIGVFTYYTYVNNTYVDLPMISVTVFR
jgi:hypothetical protein